MAANLRILGAGGHAKIAAEAWQSRGGSVLGFYDDNPALHGRVLVGSPVLGPVSEAAGGGDPLHIAIGSNVVRKRLALAHGDFVFPQVIHGSATLSPTGQIGPGTLIGAAAVLQVDCGIGAHSIINTAAIIEHDNVIGSYVHVAPGARLGGEVVVEDGAFVGTGAIVLPGVRVGRGAVVGAGAVVLRDVEPGTIVVGSPARVLPRRTADQW